jgi:hypothetical protein
MMMKKSLLIPVLLLIFLGQSLAASAVPCQMDMTTLNVTQQMGEGIDHSSHNMAPDSSDCGLDCNCPMASCVSVVMTSIDSLVLAQQPSKKFLLLASQQTTQSLTSLYRPPITH